MIILQVIYCWKSTAIEDDLWRYQVMFRAKDIDNRKYEISNTINEGLSASVE